MAIRLQSWCLRLSTIVFIVYKEPRFSVGNVAEKSVEEWEDHGWARKRVLEAAAAVVQMLELVH